jgi:hypothetical protein
MQNPQNWARQLALQRKRIGDRTPDEASLILVEAFRREVLSVPQGPLEQTVRLPHGYTVTLKWSARAGLAFKWVPEYPTFGKESASRRFWNKYYAARDSFMQEVANVLGKTITNSGLDGIKEFSPSGDRGGTQH